MRIIYLSKTSILGPASRYRIYQFRDWFEKRGHEIKIIPAFSDSYLLAEGKNGFTKYLLKGILGIKAFFKRIIDFRHVINADIVAIEREYFPCLPPVFEILIRVLKGGYILEFDDAIFLSRGRRMKYPATIKMATKVIIGNRYLEDYARRFNEKTALVPTCVDTKKYVQKKNHAVDGRLKIGWIGLPYNFHHVDIVTAAFKRIFSEYRCELVIVSARKPANKVPTTFVKWDLDSEAETLSSFDIGIMPLVDNPFSRGKCGLKILQYMAAGVPVVASPVGVNREIISDGVNGFLANSNKEWYEKLKVLIEDEELRARLGSEGRRTVEKGYDLEKIGDRLVSIYTEGMK
ncbi:MAG: glycosyltransferase [Deltaproteobacteria bacterium]|nr:glycosyltransferase [Deltaproteobacteria bacterium]NIS76642.1 glycosyltransferase [Deltaproteobacteria bacterium]